VTKDEDFACCFCHSTFCLGKLGALKYGEHGFGVRPIYVGPVVFSITIAHPSFAFGLG